MVYFIRPEDFKPKFEVVSCFLEAKGDLLLLHRSPHKPQGNTWCVPAGKVDYGETKINALVREVYEETAIKLNKDKVYYFGRIFLRFEDLDFTYYLYTTTLRSKPKVILNTEEHYEFTWAEPLRALSMELIEGETECIKMIYEID